MTDKNNNNLQRTNTLPEVNNTLTREEVSPFPLLHSISEPAIELHVKDLAQEENELVNSHGSTHHHRLVQVVNLVGASPQLLPAKSAPESSITCESIDLPSSFKQRLISFALEPHGKWAAFAGKFVNFLDLDNPTKEVFLKIPAQNYDINAVDWAKTKAESNLIATAVSNDVTVWNFATAQKSPELLYKLSGHKRFISDIAWSPFELTNLASCAADGLVYLWDIRDYAGKPSKLFRSYSAAPLKVKWNRKNSHQFLTCHGSEVRIWDVRKEAAPLETIMAHVQAITTLDWSFKKEIEFLTASQDKQVKFWHTTKPKASTETLQVGAPVHLASYTPFGRGLVTVSRFDSSLKLWSLSDLTHPIHVFNGHKDEVVSYSWRPHEDDFQLVSISKDLNLRLWTLDSRTNDAILARNPSKLKKGPKDTPNENHLTDLAQEFSLIKKQNIPGVQMKELNIQNRCATCLIENESGRLDIRATFPELYPRGAAPHFELLPTSTLKLAVMSKLAKILSETAQRRAEHNQPCLEHCLSKVVLLLKNQRSFRKLEKFDPVSEDLSSNSFHNLSPGVQFHEIDTKLMQSKHKQEQSTESLPSADSGDFREFEEFKDENIDNGTLDIEIEEETSVDSSSLTPKKRHKNYQHQSVLSSHEHKKTSRSFYMFPPHQNITMRHPHCAINHGDINYTCRINNYDRSYNTELDSKENEPQASSSLPSDSSWLSLPFTDRLASFFNYLKSSRQETKPTPDVPTYVVKPTDTLSGIAINFNLKPEQLKQWNKLYSNQLIPGQILYLANPKLPNSTGKTRQNRSVTVNETMLTKRGETLELKTPVVSTVSLDDSLVTGSSPRKLDTLEPPTAPSAEPPSPRAKLLTLKEQMMSKYKNKSETPVEVMKEPARYATLNFSVLGVLTVTPDVVIFEPDLSDKLVLKNGLLPYQVVIYVKDIFDCQIIRENPNYLYENSLEISALQNNTVNIFDFLLEEKKMRIIHRKLINWTSSFNHKTSAPPSLQNDTRFSTPLQEDEEVVDLKSETFVPSLNRPSAILSSEDLVKINRHLPNRFRFMDWKLLYGTQVHGISLHTFYQNLEDAGPSIMVVEDKERNVFGCFASDSWRIEPHYYGNGECFMFTLKPHSRFYHWSQKNANFMCSRKDFVAMGGGKHGFGLWIDNEFNNGSTYECDTFDSAPLTKSEDFQITVVEVWGFKGY